MLAQGAQEALPVEIGHEDVGHDEVDPLLADDRKRLEPVPRDEGVEPLAAQVDVFEPAYFPVVVNYQNCCHPRTLPEIQYSRKSAIVKDMEGIGKKYYRTFFLC